MIELFFLFATIVVMYLLYVIVCRRFYVDALQQRSNDPRFIVLLFGKESRRILLKVRQQQQEAATAYEPPIYERFVSRGAVDERIRAFCQQHSLRLVVGDAANASCFVSVVGRDDVACIEPNAHDAFAAESLIPSTYDWLFYAIVEEENGNDIGSSELAWLDTTQQRFATLCYDDAVIRPDLAASLKLFVNKNFASNSTRRRNCLLTTLEVVAKRSPNLMPDPLTATVIDLCDFTLLDSCFCTFIN